MFSPHHIKSRTSLVAAAETSILPSLLKCYRQPVISVWRTGINYGSGRSDPSAVISRQYLACQAPDRHLTVQPQVFPNPVTEMTRSSKYIQNLFLTHLYYRDAEKIRYMIESDDLGLCSGWSCFVSSIPLFESSVRSV
jgi:hypothetical protein